MNILESIKTIEKLYETGDLPVLVACSDKNSYICKYMKSSSAAYKLACEFIGAQFAKIWDIATPKCHFVKIKPEHWGGIHASHHLTAPALGYCFVEGTVDITPSTFANVSQTQSLLQQLLKIALFDFWVANEDRTYNNANLLYSVQSKSLVSIDYGGILNTSTFGCPLSQLTSTDTILYADIFRHLSDKFSADTVKGIATSLRSFYEKNLAAARKRNHPIVAAIPDEWKIDRSVVQAKTNELFETKWVEATWDNFVECVNENITR